MNKIKKKGRRTGMENQKGLAGKAAILPYLYLAIPFLIWVLG